jgi:hypothetical protein
MWVNIDSYHSGDAFSLVGVGVALSNRPLAFTVLNFAAGTWQVQWPDGVTMNDLSIRLSPGGWHQLDLAWDLAADGGSLSVAFDGIAETVPSPSPVQGALSESVGLGVYPFGPSGPLRVLFDDIVCDVD